MASSNHRSLPVAVLLILLAMAAYLAAEACEKVYNWCDRKLGY